METKKVAFKMFLKPDCKEEYQKRHDEIWPELKQLLMEKEPACMKTERDLTESVVNVHMPLTINFNAIENEDEVPSESNSSSPKSKCSSPIRSFDPGANENRSLPETPGSKGGSKRTLEQSVHIQKRSRFSLDFGTEAKRCEAESATAEELKESSSPKIAGMKA